MRSHRAFALEARLACDIGHEQPVHHLVADFVFDDAARDFGKRLVCDFTGENDDAVAAEHAHRVESFADFGLECFADGFGAARDTEEDVRRVLEAAKPAA